MVTGSHYRRYGHREPLSTVWLPGATVDGMVTGSHVHYRRYGHREPGLRSPFLRVHSHGSHRKPLSTVWLPGATIDGIVTGSHYRRHGHREPLSTVWSPGATIDVMVTGSHYRRYGHREPLSTVWSTGNPFRGVTAMESQGDILLFTENNRLYFLANCSTSLVVRGWCRMGGDKSV